MIKHNCICDCAQQKLKYFVNIKYKYKYFDIYIFTIYFTYIKELKFLLEN